jgi:hypothetical protein
MYHIILHGSILNFVLTIVIYAARWTKLDPTCICFKFFKLKLDPTYISFKFFLNQLNLFYIYMYLYLQQNKVYGSRKQMSRIMGYDHSLGQNDVLKFIYCFMIRFLI